MPVDRVAAFQLGVLLLAVPAQYLISKYMASPEVQRSFAIRNIVKSVSGFKERYLSLTYWQKWCQQFVAGIYLTSESDNEDPLGESPAVEVLKYRDPAGHFGASSEPRTPRPPEVKYRVGQVIRHKIWGYRAVIVGWDPVAQAPESWLNAMHPKNKPEWRKQPNYALLVDTRDRLTPQATYVPEENMEVVKNVKILHPSVDSYFENYDGMQYTPRPWLRKVYPHG